jgi:Ca2+/Na+ antiporter
MYAVIDLHPQITLTVGAVLLYAGSRVAVAATAQNTPSPARRAVAHWLPIAAAALAAVIFHQVEIALEIIFAASIAALALVGGCIAVMGSHGDEPPQWPISARRLAMMLLPATILTFMAGFGGSFSILSAIVLLLQGAVILYVKFDRTEDLEPSPTGFRIAPFIGAIAICIVGACAAIIGSTRILADLDFPSPSPLVTTVLAPLLVAPMLLGGSILAQRGQAWASAAAGAGVAELNLCLLLPLLALAWQFRRGESLYFPMASWRVDAVVLIILAAALLPAAAGRWRPGRGDGAMLLVIYVGYVLASIVISVMV